MADRAMPEAGLAAIAPAKGMDERAGPMQRMEKQISRQIWPATLGSASFKRLNIFIRRYNFLCLQSVLLRQKRE
jgi:hypothetical protein